MIYVTHSKDHGRLLFSSTALAAGLLVATNVAAQPMEPDDHGSGVNDGTPEEAGPWFDAEDAEEEREAAPSSEADSVDGIERPEGQARASTESAASKTPKKVKKPKKAKKATKAKKSSGDAGCGSCRFNHHRHRRHRGGLGMVSLVAGRAQVETAALDERLSTLGYDSLPDRYGMIGLHGWRVFDRGFMVGLGVTGWRGRELDGPGATTARLSGLSGHLALGGALVKTEKWLVFPAVMVGAQAMRLSIDASGSDGFDDVLGDPAREATLTQGSGFVGAMLGIDRRFYSRHRSGRFFDIGLRVGVTKAFTASDWALGEDSVARSGPTDLPSMKFLAISVGFGRDRDF